MTDSNKVSFSILIDPRDLGNVIGTENSIDPMRLTALPDGFHPVSWVAADAMIAFARARRAAREAGIADSSWTEHLYDVLLKLADALRDHHGWGPDRPYDMNTFCIGEGPRDERLVCRDLEGFADAGELAEENARLYGAASVGELAESAWGCDSLLPTKVRHFGAGGFRGLEFSFDDGAETRMRAWQFNACPKVAAALAAALTHRCEKGFYMEAGCPGDKPGMWSLSHDRKNPGKFAVGKSRSILLESTDDGKIAFKHPTAVPDRLVDNFIPAMKRCDVNGPGPTSEIERAPEGITAGAVMPGNIRVGFPTLAERARAAALATARGATGAPGHRL